MVIAVAAIVEIDLPTDRMLAVGENKIHLLLNYSLVSQTIRSCG